MVDVLTYSYATHHRHTCIGARAGFGDLLIGAGAPMCEANGLDPGAKSSLREPMVELIKIVEGFYARGVAASVYASADRLAGNFMPEPVFANIGKLLLATQIYDMHRLAHEVSGGLVVTLPGPDEDHNPATAATLAEVLRANPAVPYDKRIEVARFIEDLTASYLGGWYSVISLHGAGSPAAMKQEIWRQYPLGDKVALVERLLERGVGARPIDKAGWPDRPVRCDQVRRTDDVRRSDQASLTTTRPRTWPAISRPAASIAPSSGTSVIMVSSSDVSRSRASRAQASSRRGRGHITLSMPASVTPRRMNGATEPGRSMPCASPQAATVPP